MIIVYRGKAYTDPEPMRELAGWGPELLRNILADTARDPSSHPSLQVVHPGRKMSKRVQLARVETAGAYKNSLFNILNESLEQIRMNDLMAENHRGIVHATQDLLRVLAQDTMDLED